MNFNQMMDALQNNEIATRPGWASAIALDPAGFVIYVDKEYRNESDFWMSYEFEIADFHATDWEIV